LLDPIMSPQLVTVATMLLVAILVPTNTVSADGSIGGVYAAGLQLAERTVQSRSVTDYPLQVTGDQEQKPAAAPEQKQGADQQKNANSHKPDGDGHNNR